MPYGKHLRVHEGDRVEAGERLSEGSVNPHDILRVQGVNKVQEYLVNEIQDVYRLQAVEINDKHIEVIVKQMLQKVRIVDPGDTNFLEGEEVDKIRFNRENDKVIYEGGDPATCQPILLGITRASTAHGQLYLCRFLSRDDARVDRGGRARQDRPFARP